MNVSLTPELEEYVAGKVASGLYQSASEVVQDALQALREKDELARKRAALIADIQEGIDSLEAGRWKATTAEEIVAEARKRRGA